MLCNAYRYCCATTRTGLYSPALLESEQILICLTLFRQKMSPKCKVEVTTVGVSHLSASAPEIRQRIVLEEVEADR
jgi:hypothetical protein